MADKISPKGHDHVFDLLMQDDEITWQNIITDLVKSEEMDPWDVNITTLSQKYLERVKEMEDLNFFVSGKVILASAILLKLKSNQFLLQHIADFDNLLYPPEEELGDPDDFMMNAPEAPAYLKNKNLSLTIKTPQPRKRKVSVQDLVGALKKALEVENRKVARVLQSKHVPDMEVPEAKIDINNLMKELHTKVKTYFEKNKADMTFTGLVKSDRREDKIVTFVPLLHLSNQEKINLNQPEHFKEIFINLNKGGKK